MTTPPTGAVHNQNTERETRLVPNVTTDAATETSASLLDQIPYDPGYVMDRFHGRIQASNEQYERPPLCLAPTESKVEVEARVQAMLRDFDTQFKSSNNAPPG